MIGAVVRRDMRLSFARGTEGAVVLSFFIVVVSLFPFALGSGDVLRAAAPGIVWVGALLSMLLAAEGVWHRDFEDGTFDLLLLSRHPAWKVVLSKMMSHWLMVGLPLVFGGMVSALMLRAPFGAAVATGASLLLGTIYMCLMAGLGAVLTFGARRPGMLVALIVLPLLVPVLVLGVMAGDAALAGGAWRAYVLLEAALVVAALPLAPAAAAKFLETQVRSS